jgi:hypothetical protein
VRWAAASAALFAAGLAARLAHGPAWLAWTLFLACYAAGGWEPGLAGLRALRGRRLESKVTDPGATADVAQVAVALTLRDSRVAGTPSAARTQPSSRRRLMPARQLAKTLMTRR